MNLLARLYEKIHYKEDISRTENNDYLNTILPVEYSKKSEDPLHSPSNILQPRKATSISAKNFKTAQIRIPEQLETADLRWIFGDYYYHQSKSNHSSHFIGKVDGEQLKDLKTDALKGVRWKYDPHLKILIIEGRSDVKIENAVRVFRERILSKIKIQQQEH